MSQDYQIRVNLNITRGVSTESIIGVSRGVRSGAEIDRDINSGVRRSFGRVIGIGVGSGVGGEFESYNDG